MGHVLSWARDRWYVLLPVLVALPIQLVGLTSMPLWFDELFTASAIENGFAGLQEHSWELPLLPYYFLMYLWTFGGTVTDDWWLRASSVVAMTAMVAVTAATGRRMTAPSAGAAAGLLVAVSTWTVKYSQDARSYALGALLVSLSTYFLVRALQTPEDSRRQLQRYTWVLILSAVFVQTALLVLVVHPVILLASARRSWLKPWFRSVAWASPVILGAGLLYLTHGQTMHSWLASPTVARFVEWPQTLMPPTQLAFLAVVLALLTGTGRALLIGLLAGVSAVWVLSHVGASFWLGGVIGMLISIFALAAGSALAGVSWRIVVLFGAVLLLFQAESIQRQQFPTGVRTEKAVLDAVVARGEEPVVVFQSPGTAVNQAFRHYAPNLDVTVLSSADPPPAGPYWSMLTDWQCPQAQKIPINDSVTLTYCPALTPSSSTPG